MCRDKVGVCKLLLVHKCVSDPVSSDPSRVTRELYQLHAVLALQTHANESGSTCNMGSTPSLTIFWATFNWLANRSMIFDVK